MLKGEDRDLTLPGENNVEKKKCWEFHASLCAYFFI